MPGKENALTAMIRQGDSIGTWSIVKMAFRLSVPSIMAQLAVIAMEYIDASMVGRLGADAAASIGLIATSTWLFTGICWAVCAGFYVQVAHLLGARDIDGARSVMRQSFSSALVAGIILGVAGVSIAPFLPGWLGGTDAINANAGRYFSIFSMAMPVIIFNYLLNGLLRCSGNMVLPGIMGVTMCVLDVIFNFFLIFPTRELSVFGVSFMMPGFGFGVWGAALGTAVAELTVTAVLMAVIWWRDSDLRLSGTHGSFLPHRRIVRKAIKIGFPMGLERFITTAAQIVITMIVAPLGACAIAANAFAVTAEGICYMPGFGISDAATTLVGQSLGAGKKKLASRFAWITVAMGMTVMGVMGALMYAAAPLIIGIMTPDREIVDLGVMALRIEAFAEPMFAASIVAYGVFIGAGDTLMPACMNLASMWGVRITLAALLAPTMGLRGVWLAMCIELCFRGLIFIIRLNTPKWQNKL